jgi:hypothetical protein
VLFNREGDWCWFALEASLPESLAEQIERSTFAALSAKERQARANTPGRQFGNVRYELALRLVDEAFEVSYESLYLLPRDGSLIERPAGLWTDRIEEDDPLICTVIQRSSDGVTTIQPEVRLPDEARERRAGRLPIRANVPPHTPALSGVLLDISQYAACHWLREFLAGGTPPVLLNIPAMRQAQRPPGKKFSVAADGTTLPWSVLELVRHQDAYTEWLDHIRDALPFLTAVRGRQREDDHHAYLEVEYETGVTVKSIGLSDGT